MNKHVVAWGIIIIVFIGFCFVMWKVMRGTPEQIIPPTDTGSSVVPDQSYPVPADGGKG